MRVRLTCLIFAALLLFGACEQYPYPTKWDALAQCESSGRWSIVDPPYTGGLQFTSSTWIAYGGRRYARTANLATRDQQITVAIAVQRGQGWGAWPVCSRKVGLR